MNIQQLEFLVELERHDFNISRAAKALSTSQPNVTMGIQAVEYETGMQLFERKDRRILGWSEDGEVVMSKARLIVQEYGQLTAIAKRKKEKGGALRVITTHSQARYLLPPFVEKFVKTNRNVGISIVQGKNDQIVDDLTLGNADVGLFNSTVTDNPNLVFIPYGVCGRVIIAPKGHELSLISKPTLEDLTRYPIVIYEPAASNSTIVGTLEKLSKNAPQVIHCTNTDVVKTYVKRGIGISVVPDFVLDENDDLVAIDATHLFEYSMLYVVLKRRKIRNAHLYGFVGLLAPALTKEVLDAAVA